MGGGREGKYVLVECERPLVWACVRVINNLLCVCAFVCVLVRISSCTHSSTLSHRARPRALVPRTLASWSVRVVGRRLGGSVNGS